jgi:cytochrome b561
MSYTRVSIILHWLMLLLFIGVYASIESRVLFERGSAVREGVKTLHFMLGLTIFTLVWLRLAARLRWPAPPISPRPPRWQTGASHAVHGLLYLLMIGMPLGGWLILSGEGETIPFWGLQLPPLTGPDKALAKQIEEIHETIGKIGYGLIGLHATAALAHHYLWKDNTLRRMLGRG